MRKLIIFLVTLFLTVLTQAQSNLHVTLRDGSELVGYISRQRPGENFTFATSRATVVLPASGVHSMVDNIVPLSSLSEQWQQWATTHNAVVCDAVGDSVVTLTDIVTDRGTLTRVRVLERGAKVKYLQIGSDSFELDWSDLVVVKCPPRNPLTLLGVNRRYQLKSGEEYEGQYFEEVPGETLSLYGDNGMVEVFNTSDVVKDSRIPVNPDLSLYEQSDLVDIIEFKDGRPDCEGIIFERNYFDVDESTTHEAQLDYLRMLLDDGSTIDVNLDDIAEYRKAINPFYNTVTGATLAEDEFLINGTPATVLDAYETQGLIRLPGGQYDVEDDAVVVSLDDNGQRAICIEARLADPAQAQSFKFLRARRYMDKKTKQVYYAITYENLVKDVQTPIKVETSANGITRFEFEVTEAYLYIFYNPMTARIVALRVE